MPTPDANTRLLLGFLATIAVLVLAMLLGPEIADLDSGDLATWFSGLATTAVAALAVKISRDSHRTARAALADQLRKEASNVTWWFEIGLKGMPHELDPGVGWFVDEWNLLPWEQGMPEDDEGKAYAIVCVSNENPTLVGDAKVLVEHSMVNPWSQGLKTVGPLRPGITRNAVIIEGASQTPGTLHKATERARMNAYVTWLEFTDSNGFSWRRHANGRLEPLDARMKRLLS